MISELGTSQRFRVLRGKTYSIGGLCPISIFTGKTVATAAYGSILATGDFNGDGLNDLVAGAYENHDGGDVDTGGAQVLYQSEFIFAGGFDDD